MFTIEYADDIAQDLAGLTAYRRKVILDAIEKNLQYEPNVETRHRKQLPSLVPPWEHVAPVWELRIGEYRVFYDVQGAEETVKVRAIRHKPPHKTTEEIL